MAYLAVKLAHMQLNFPIVIHQKSLQDNLLKAISSFIFLQPQFGVIYGKGQVTTLQTSVLKDSDVKFDKTTSQVGSISAAL